MNRMNSKKIGDHALRISAPVIAHRRLRYAEHERRQHRAAVVAEAAQRDDDESEDGEAVGRCVPQAG